MIISFSFIFVISILLIINFLFNFGLSITYLLYVAYIKNAGNLSDDEKKVFINSKYFGTGFGLIIAVTLIKYFLPFKILKIILILISIGCLSIISIDHINFNNKIKYDTKENNNLKKYKKKYNNISIFTIVTFVISILLRFIFILL